MMSAHNGESYIASQLDSIFAQTGVDITLAVRDDGSSDRTPSILYAYAKEHENMTVCTGDNLGYAGSFWSLLLEAPDTYDYYAFSDQDDVWDEDKLSAAIHALRQSAQPLRLYASALNVTDENLNFQYTNEFKRLKPRLGSAFTRPRLSGCTMVFNSALLRLCRSMDIRQAAGSRLSHDGAVYLSFLACGGKITFSRKSHISLRRHSQTVTGHGKGLLKRIASVLNIFTTRKNEATSQAAFLYGHLRESMTEESRQLCETILNYRHSPASTLKLCFDSRIRCNLASVDIVTFFAVLFHCY